MVTAEFHPKFAFLFEPHPYKVAHSGRVGLKSWSFARALLIQGAEKRLRILCAREVQRSIKDSVKQLLDDQIGVLGLGGVYDSLRDEIRGALGTQFLFAGLSDLTAESIKSYEGIDIVWVEEARAVTKRSWGILIPTIRKEGSEIWVSFNPELDTDDTYTRFVVKPPPGAVVVKTSWRDAQEMGWWTEKLEAERVHLLTTDPTEYDNIWEGNPRQAVEGAIYGREIAAMHSEKRYGRVPYDPALKVHTIWDLGFADSMAIIFAQRLASEIRVIDYIEDSQKRLDEYVEMLRDRKYNYGTDWIPHDGAAKDIKTGKSTEEHLRGMGRNVRVIPRGDVEEGIKAARQMFPRTYFDEKAVALVDHLKRYRRHIPKTTNEPATPVHDAHSHGADAFRELAVVADQLYNHDEIKPDLSLYQPRGIGLG